MPRSSPPRPRPVRVVHTVSRAAAGRRRHQLLRLVSDADRSRLPRPPPRRASRPAPRRHSLFPGHHGVRRPAVLAWCPPKLGARSRPVHDIVGAGVSASEVVRDKGSERSGGAARWTVGWARTGANGRSLGRAWSTRGYSQTRAQTFPGAEQTPVRARLAPSRSRGDRSAVTRRRRNSGRARSGGRPETARVWRSRRHRRHRCGHGISTAGTGAGGDICSGLVYLVRCSCQDVPRR